MADFLKINNDEMVRVSTVSAIAVTGVRDIAFRSDNKDYLLRIDGMPATVELGLEILDEATDLLERIVSAEDILNSIRSEIEH